MATQTQTAAKTKGTRKDATTQSNGAEQQTAKKEIDMGAFRKWVTETWLPNLSPKDRKSFDLLPLADRRETSLKAYEEFLNKPKPAKAKEQREETAERLEEVGIRVTEDGKTVIRELEALPPSTNKGIPSPDSARGQVLARKRLDADFLGGTVVFVKADYTRA